MSEVQPEPVEVAAHGDISEDGETVRVKIEAPGVKLKIKIEGDLGLEVIHTVVAALPQTLGTLFVQMAGEEALAALVPEDGYKDGDF